MVVAGEPRRPHVCGDGLELLPLSLKITIGKVNTV